MAQEFLTSRVAKVTFDATGGKAIGTYSLGLLIPKGALVTDVFYNVRTTFTTAASDTGTIAIGLQADNDVVSAIAVSDAGNVWDAGIRGGLVGAPALGSASNNIVVGTPILYTAAKAASVLGLTAHRELTLKVAVQALTAGVMDIYVSYLV